LYSHLALKAPPSDSPHFVAVSSSCRYLRDEIRRIAPWMPIFAKQVAEEPEPASSVSPEPGKKPKRPADEVDPKDLEKDPYKALAKYGSRLCLGCFKLQKNCSKLVSFRCPAGLLDFLEKPKRAEKYRRIWKLEPKQQGGAVPDEEEEETDKEPYASTDLCAPCHGNLWSIAKILGNAKKQGWIRSIPDCSAPYKKEDKNWIFQKTALFLFRLKAEDLVGVPFEKVHIATRWRRSRRGESYPAFEIYEYRYDGTDVLLAAWRKYGGPWGHEVSFKTCDRMVAGEKKILLPGRIGVSGSFGAMGQRGF